MPSRDAGARPAWRVGDKIRRAREYAGLEQRELAHAAGISQATVSAAETGRARPHRSTLMLIAAATGVAYEWLEDCDEDPDAVRRDAHRRRLASFHSDAVA
jgi:transcriptional regulator with XRE-family HTH domain